ncbi:MAG: hypothetical protein JWP89_816 [Schlesneria sp.]|nr:hypothetical protein [Schlesneria sp.]
MLRPFRPLHFSITLNLGRRYEALPLRSALGWYLAAFQAFSEQD